VVEVESEIESESEENDEGKNLKEITEEKKNKDKTNMR